MKFKKTLIFQIIAVLALSLMIPFQQTKAASLTDIPAGFKTEIDILIQKGIISGYPDKTFRPKNKITREEAAKMIGTALNLKGEKRETEFSDVNPNSFGSGYIASAVEKGIITGHSDGTFRPKDNITRGQIALMLTRAFGLKGKDIAVFKDVSPDHEQLYAAVDAMFSNGITVGIGKGLYEPNEENNRAEFSAFLARSLTPSLRQQVKVNEYFVNTNPSDPLNVRLGPGTHYDPIGKLSTGTRVLTAGTNDEWQYVKSSTLTGYVHYAYLVNAEGGMIEADIPKPPQPTTSKRHIAIDAGHGGSDPGAAGFGLVEKQVTLAIAKKVEKRLQKENVKVFMTRKDDRFVGLQERVTLAKNAKVDTLVSIHMNSFSSSSASGTESYYSTSRLASAVDDSKQLATFIQNRLYKALNTTNRGVKTAPFAVIRTPFPSSLIEVAFISNKQDAEKIATEKYKDIAAEAITAGIMDYYKWKEK